MPPLLPHILHTKIVTFVIFPATPRPVPSKKRQRFILCNSYRGGFAATPLTVSRKQMFIPVHAKPSGFVAMTRLFQRQPGNSRFAGLLPDSEVILVVDIAEIPEKRAFRGVCPSSVHAAAYWRNITECLRAGAFGSSVRR